MPTNGCSKQLCPMQVGTVDNCTLTKEQCPYFTQDIDYQNILNQIKAVVAREIFAEIEELLNEQTEIACETRDKHRETDEPILSFIAMLDGRIYSLRVIEEHIAELKKKYESEDNK